MHGYKLTISYDGTHYSGWQIQPNALSIQEVMQGVLQTLFHQPIALIGSGRTDAGVHAYGQVAHFRHAEELDLHKLLMSLNGLLPRDIRVKKVERVSDQFHAQYDAIGKEYHYHLHLDRVMDPFKRLYCWHIHRKINVELLEKASQCFVGTHDFTTFANEAHTGSAAKNPVRTLYRLATIPVEGGVRLEFEGNGFLYKMVRNMTGTLIEVASGCRSIDDIKILFQAKDRRMAGIAAPPHGLFLMRVDYPSII